MTSTGATTAPTAEDTFSQQYPQLEVTKILAPVAEITQVIETVSRTTGPSQSDLDAIESIAPWGAGTYRLVLERESDLGVPLARSRAGDLKSLIPWSASVFEN